MPEDEAIQQPGNKPARFSYLFMLATLILAGWLHMATLLVAALFAYLALARLQIKKSWSRWLAVGAFIILLSVTAYGLGYLVNQTARALPEIADKAIPSVIQLAKDHQIELSFTDYDSLKDLAYDTVKSQVQYLASFARFARGATKQILFLIVGCIVAISLFLNPRIEVYRNAHGPNNLYSLCCEAIALRFRTFYESFVTVMGAQIIISAINTVFTAAFVLAMGLPYALVVIGLTFFCGLLPVVGNLISNTIIVGIGISVSPKTALIALIFLVVIHKLEYFLNSKIIGHRIRNPLWLTLLALILGERLMGIPGMILAPVVLNYIRMEASQIRISKAPEIPELEISRK